MSATIAVFYALYEESGGDFERVTSTADLAIEAELASADTVKQVTQVTGVQEQIDELHAYVQQVPFEQPIDGLTIQFSGMQPSRYTSDSKGWATVVQGAAIYYPLEPDNSDPVRLYLAVWTADAQGDGE